jgi:uncharacterized protein (DUF433 family)
MIENLFVKDWEKQIYHLPTYSITDASRYLHIPLPTLKTWLNGRKYPTKLGDKEFLPIIQRPDPKKPQLSFTNLIEAHILRVIRTVHNIPLDQVRLALDYISNQLNTNHPLVTKEFSTDGVDLFIEQVEHLINVSRSGQLAMKKVLTDLLTRVEWNQENIATRLYPIINHSLDEKILTIDPHIAFGKPTITGTGIPTLVIAQLYDAGDSIEDIAEDYDCTIFQIERAILFESQLIAA